MSAARPVMFPVDSWARHTRVREPIRLAEPDTHWGQTTYLGCRVGAAAQEGGPTSDLAALAAGEVTTSTASWPRWVRLGSPTPFTRMSFQPTGEVEDFRGYGEPSVALPGW